MRLAPALTWLHLFPTDTALHAPNVPDWFGRLIDGPPDGGRRARVLFDAGPDAVTEAARHGGVVVVNGRGLTAEFFTRLGYPYVRRFAAVPNLAEARWFVPLDAPAVTAAGFDLFSPAKRTARIKLAAVRMAARLRVGGWYKDSLWVASHEQPPLEAMLHRVLPVGAFRLALSAGAPEPARNRKASAAVIDMAGKTRAFVKLPTSPLADTLVRREAAALAGLAERFAGTSCLVPELLFAGEYDRRYALVQAPLAGKPTVPQLTPAHRHFLNTLSFPGERRRAAESPFFTQLLERAEYCSVDAPELHRILTSITPALADTDVPRTVIHGDFAPWNVRLRPGADCISVFDWEYGVLDGLPLIDETHFVVQVGYLLNDWSPEKVAHTLETLAAADTRFGPEAARALQCVYLADSLARLLEEGYAPADDMIVWYRRVLGLSRAAADVRKQPVHA